MGPGVRIWGISYTWPWAPDPDASGPLISYVTAPSDIKLKDVVAAFEKEHSEYEIFKTEDLGPLSFSIVRNNLKQLITVR